MRKEYDFSKGVRGKYAAAYAKAKAKGGLTVVLESDEAYTARIVQLDPDVAKVFKNSRAVNIALRGLVRLTDKKIRADLRETKLLKAKSIDSHDS